MPFAAEIEESMKIVARRWNAGNGPLARSRAAKRYGRQGRRSCQSHRFIDGMIERAAGGCYDTPAGAEFVSLAEFELSRAWTFRGGLLRLPPADADENETAHGKQRH